MSVQIEQKIDNYPESVNKEKTKTIFKQMESCIGKIYTGEGKSGTGFFCCVPYENEEKKVFITNYHIINEKFIKEKDKIKLGIDNDHITIDIPIEKDAKIYLSPEKKNDLVIIEIKNTNNLQKIEFLKLDDKLLTENPESIYETKNSIYIIQYPREVCVSYGIVKKINDNKIQHLCWTDKGSSGSPILSLETMKVIGVHKGCEKIFNYNLGIFLRNPIKNLKNEMKKIKEIKKNYFEINKSNENNEIFIQELLKNNLISKEELEQNLNGKVFENNGNNYLMKHKEDLYEGILENDEWKKNKYILERYIEDGIYNIIPKHCNNMAIDISCGNNENMANLQLYEYNNSKAQQFEVKYNYEYKYYTIKCLCSNKFLSVDCKNNFNIVQYEENYKINQQWHIVLRDNYSYEIISEIKGNLMNVDGYGDSSGTNISCQKGTGKLNQQFQFEIPPTPEGIKYFKKPLFHGQYSNQNSIVDGLKSIGEDSSLDYRTKIALKNGIQEYNIDDNVKENLEMIKLLKDGKLKKP